MDVALPWKNDILDALQELYQDDAAVQEEANTYEDNDMVMDCLKAECWGRNLKVG